MLDILELLVYLIIIGLSVALLLAQIKLFLISKNLEELVRIARSADERLHRLERATRHSAEPTPEGTAPRQPTKKRPAVPAAGTDENGVFTLR